MQKVLYTSEVNITSAHAMQYTNGFFVAGEITNKGKIVINECYIAVNEVRDEKGSKVMKILNSLFPKSSSGISIEIDIEVGETKNFAVIVPNLKAKEPFLYRIYVDCYLSNKFAQKMQKNEKPSTDIITPKPPKDNVETTQPPAQNTEDTQEEAEQPAQEGIEEETDKQDLQNQEASVPEQKAPRKHNHLYNPLPILLHHPQRILPHHLPQALLYNPQQIRQSHKDFNFLRIFLMKKLTYLLPLTLYSYFFRT